MADVHPSTPELTLIDESFILANKHRLGIRPVEDLPPKCPCDTDLSTDSPQHFYSCRQQLRRAMTVRHDSIVRFLRDAFVMVGAAVTIEPRLYNTERLRPDLDILLPDQHVTLDVAIANPVAPSRKLDRRFAAADDLQGRKNTKYKEWSHQQGAKFLPFIMETPGALGKQTAGVFKLLAKAAATATIGMSVAEFMRSRRQALSVTLQRGNALVVKMGAINARASAAAAQRAMRYL